MLDDEMREIFANAPVVKDTFEVITITASWFSKKYHLQYNFTEGVHVPFETGEQVLADYVPMKIGKASSNADMTYERNIVIQQVNDKIAGEIALRDPESDEQPVLESRGYVMYRDGSVSQLKTPVVTIDINKTTRDDIGVNVSCSTKPVNAQSTGETVTTTRVPMTKAFL